jgi:hypothetical protein
MDKKSRSGSYFGELRNNLWGLKILKFFEADPGSVMEKFGSGIQDKHHGSATLHMVNIRSAQNKFFCNITNSVFRNKITFSYR